MPSVNVSKWPNMFLLGIIILGALGGILSHHLGFGITSTVDRVIFTKANVFNTQGPIQNKSDHDEHRYKIQIFSKDPVVVVIDSFLSSEEVAHLLQLRCKRIVHQLHWVLLANVFVASEGKFETSKVFRGYEGFVDPEIRISESARIDPDDEVVHRIVRRAERFQGWRGNNTIMEQPTVQRYQVDGFYNYHYDWDPSLTEGNRVTTFMVYLDAGCTGGGTNFPYLEYPNSTLWCDTIECSEEGRDGFQGVTFKPVAGSAVYWENLHINGSGHTGVYHAGLPVKSGTKIGLNIWSWDSSWRKPNSTI